MLALLLSLLPPFLGSAQVPTDVGDLLRRPVSPGVLALLVEHAALPDVRRRIGDAVTHQTPEIRAAAARVAFVAGLDDLVPQLQGALTSETLADAGIEQIRALMSLGSADHATLIGDARTRLGLNAQDHRDLDADGTEPGGVETPLSPPDGRAGTQTPAPYPPGFLRDVLLVTGCSENKARVGNTYAVGEGKVVLKGDGRTANVALAGPVLARECANATRILLSTHVVERFPAAPNERRTILIPLSPEFVRCGDERTPRRVRKWGKDVETRKMRHVNPIFPKTAQRDRAQGIVILDAVIAPTGCIQEVHVLKGIDERLDLAALVAVSGWQFTAPLVATQPAKVAITATVSFFYKE